MEPRTLIAYALITLMALIVAWLVHRARIRRKDRRRTRRYHF